MAQTAGPITASWFLFSEENKPLGQINRRGDDDPTPSLGQDLGGGASWSVATVLEFEEVRATCGIRRFRVVVRVVD
jgi:hypothetical protein